MKNEFKEEFPSNSNLPQTRNSRAINAGSIIDSALSNLTEEQYQALIAKASEESIRLEVESRECAQRYMYGRKQIEDHIDAFNMIEKRDRMSGHKITSNINTATGSMRIESKSGRACFVATATYGDVNHPDVVLLRSFRDNILSKSVSGRIFIKTYWIIGPKLAVLVKKNNSLRLFSRRMLERLIHFIQRKYDLH